MRDVTVAGILAGLVFGVMIQFGLDRMTSIGALYTLGEPSLSVGWIAHLVHSSVFALVFGVVTWWRPLADRLTGPGSGAVMGLAYGFGLWAVNIVVIWPLWLSAAGAPNAPTFPFISGPPLLGHLVWGGLMGGIYLALRQRQSPV